MRSFVAVLVAVVASASVARADGLPDRPEEHCTLDDVVRADGHCEACRVGRADPDACARAHAGTAAARKCRSLGRDAWTEVWCTPAPATSDPPVVAAAPEAPAPPAPTHAATTHASGCAVGGVGSGLVAIGLAAAVLASLSRARRHAASR